MIDIVGMSHAAHRKLGTYSAMQQRIGLAQAFENDPELVVLDGPPMASTWWAASKSEKSCFACVSRGTAIFLNSHLLSELETVCDRVAIMLDGTVPARYARTAGKHHGD